MTIDKIDVVANVNASDVASGAELSQIDLKDENNEVKDSYRNKF